MFKNFLSHIDSILARDPAARSRIEVILLYPGVHAVLWHRLAHGAWRARWYFTARAISQFARLLTGIEIHPGAVIGSHLFIDHGAGIVIGETAIIGDNVTLYHHVTLGGTSACPRVEGQAIRRHPALGHGVIAGAGAQILGLITIGAGARIGANAVVLADVAAGITVVGIPARPIGTDAGNGTDVASARETSDAPMPIEAETAELRRALNRISARLNILENSDTTGDTVAARLSGS